MSGRRDAGVYCLAQLKGQRMGQEAGLENLTASDLVEGGIESESRRLGRRLILSFEGKHKPDLNRAEFHCSKRHSQHSYIQQRDNNGHSFTFTPTPKALSLLFLEYKCAGLDKREGDFTFPGSRIGSLAATLGNAMQQNAGPLYDLFTEYSAAGGALPRVANVFTGRNLDGKDKTHHERRIKVISDYLPADCVEVIWNGKLLRERDDLWKLAQKIRSDWKLEASQQPESPKGEGSRQSGQPSQPQTQPKSEPSKVEKKPEPKPEATPPKREAEPSPNAEAFKLSAWLAEEFRETLNALQAGAKSERPKSGAAGIPPEFQDLFEQGTPKAQRIDPRLFEITNPDELYWEDSNGLINFGDSTSDADLWRIRDASEGLAIFGGVGSGKTSSSGALVAKAFLKAGYGGLVLAVKPDEGRRWVRLCERMGRASDCIHVTAQSGHGLNVLAYEGQRPGERIGLAKDLISLFRLLIDVMSRNPDSKVHADFWTHSVNQLMGAIFNIFLLAGEPLAIESFIRFVNYAPKEPTREWRRLKYFGDLLARAADAARASTEKDREAFRKAVEYWMVNYPTIPHDTRGGIITGFTSMADNMTESGVYELISQDTNVTPEMILSGKVVILDLPQKGNREGAHIVQSAWKLLFQQAIERRADKGLDTARPVFLWEDEGHLTFNHYDCEFQPTARDCRAAHVIISQNLHNFHRHGHTQHDVMSVFSAMNTHIFHSNGDDYTNRWASEKIGLTRRLKVSASNLFSPLKASDVTFFPRDPVESKGSISLGEEKEPAIPPERFAQLKRGGDGTSEAVIHWISHRFAINESRNYCVKVFEQDEQ